MDSNNTNKTLNKGKEGYILNLVFIPMVIYMVTSEQSIKLISSGFVVLITAIYTYFYLKSDHFKQATLRRKTINLGAVLALMGVTLFFMIGRSYIPTSVMNVSSTLEIKGISMSPNFQDGNIVEIAPLTDISRGDVVIYKYKTIKIIGRVVGLPAESFAVSNCKVLINSKPITEAYLATGSCTKAGKFIKENLITRALGDGYFILGDNRENSIDSRDIGPISRINIVEKVTRKLN